jgi:hypothetical protein
MIKKLPWTKKLTFSLIILTLFLCALEVGFRLIQHNRATLINVGLPEEHYGIAVPDPDLLWALKPNYSGVVQGGTVSTNGMGLRGKEIKEKGENEVQILSLGESTTFGAKVADDQTYSHLLEQMLNQTDKEIEYRVINGGVFAYSSTQSLIYLKKRGMNLMPDIILFYHEVNDYLPSALRISSNNEMGMMKTDKQLIESNLHRLVRFIAYYSAAFRFFSNLRVSHQLNQVKEENINNPIRDVGLPDLRVPPRLRIQKDGQTKTLPVNEILLGRRVSDEERWDNFLELKKLCQLNGVKLLIIHPTYRNSQPHPCLLTEFCKTYNIPMLDAHQCISNQKKDLSDLFLDSWHPSPSTHKKIAQCIFQKLIDEGMIRSN